LSGGLQSVEKVPPDAKTPDDVIEWGYLAGKPTNPAIGETPFTICTLEFRVKTAGTSVNTTISIRDFAVLRVTAKESNVPGYPIYETTSEEFANISISVTRSGGGDSGGGGGGGGGGGDPIPGDATPTPTPAPATPTPDNSKTPPPARQTAEPDGTSGGITFINDGVTPLGISFLKAHVQFIFGYPDGTVHPDSSITRAEAVTIFYRLIDDVAKDSPLPNPFNDVPAGEWYEQYVSYAARRGIVLGYPDGGFRPENNITRAEFATIMSRFVEASSSSTASFKDVSGDHWAIGYIKTCAANGWITGYPDGSFRPENPITRAEAVTVLNRALNRGIALEDVPATVPSYSDLPRDHWAYTQVIEASVQHEFTRNAKGTEIWN
jgi:hypothetical protein